MKFIKAFLFDFDGVIADTEPQYDEYMNRLGEKYNLGIENFAEKVKGTPTPDIMNKYFIHLGTDECKIIEKQLIDFELIMNFPEVTGALKFIKLVKDKGYKTGLVTSSQKIKMQRALQLLNLTDSFDTIVTADRITKGKPNPMCYLLAADDLNISPAECIVFEDSLHGINAAVAAKMNVIGVTTSFSKDKMNAEIIMDISNFKDSSIILEHIESLN